MRFALAGDVAELTFGRNRHTTATPAKWRGRQSVLAFQPSTDGSEEIAPGKGTERIAGGRAISRQVSRP